MAATENEQREEVEGDRDGQEVAHHSHVVPVHYCVCSVDIGSAQLL